MAIEDLSPYLRDNFEVFEWNHASAVLLSDFPDHWDDLEYVLSRYRLPKSHIEAGGGNKGPIARAIDMAFGGRGWNEAHFDVSVQVNSETRDTRTHKVDFFKPGSTGGVAIEVEWNNKDEFFDRDLNNFRLLQELGVISVGVIITRSTSLNEIFRNLGRDVWKKYGSTTTHTEQLLRRVHSGGAGGCPVIAFGITPNLYDPDS